MSPSKVRLKSFLLILIIFNNWKLKSNRKKREQLKVLLEHLEEDSALKSVSQRDSEFSTILTRRKFELESEDQNQIDFNSPLNSQKCSVWLFNLNKTILSINIKQFILLYYKKPKSNSQNITGQNERRVIRKSKTLRGFHQQMYAVKVQCQLHDSIDDSLKNVKMKHNVNVKYRNDWKLTNLMNLITIKYNVNVLS